MAQPIEDAESGRALKLSVLMPVYNERYLVRTSIARVLALDSPLLSGIELIVVDDGSTDGTAEILHELASGHPEIRYLPRQENAGKGAALREAIKEATGDLTVVQDADLEYDPRDWERLIRPFFEAGADAVYGSRFAASEYRRVLLFWHAAGNRLLTLLSNLATGLNLTDMETCYKMVRTELLKSIPIRSNDFSIEAELTAKLAKRGAVIFEVPIRYRGRTYQEGKKITWRHGLTALWSILRWRLEDDLYTDDEYGADILTGMSQVHRFNRWMADVLQPFVGQRVLEIGAGLGNLTHHFLPREEYVASDLNPHYLRYLSNQSTARPYLQVERVDLADGTSFDSLEGRFDTVICLNVLEHVAQEHQAVRNISDSLAPGGRALILVPQGKWLFSPLDEALGHVKRYSAAELVEALEKAGFSVERVFGFNRFGVLGWLLNGKTLRRRHFSRIQLKLLNTLVPFVRVVDRFLPWPALSVVAVARKPDGGTSLP